MSEMNPWRIFALVMVSLTMLAGYIAWDATQSLVVALDKLKRGEVELTVLMDPKGNLGVIVNKNPDSLKVYPGVCQKRF